MTSRIPIILITGYLGAGKTTLINHLLRADHGRRIAVLVNDFGAINIDAALIGDQTENTISLTNGCVCCSITDDLGTALDELASQSQPPELVVLEASGVAEPARLARHVGNWPGFELESIITLLDAETAQLRAKNKFVGRLVQNQIAAADLLILTKTDLVSQELCLGLRPWLRKIAPNAALIESEAGKVAPELILGIASKSGSIIAEESHAHSHDFYTYYWTPPASLSKDRLIEVLAELPSSVHRVKGFFIEADSGDVILLQRVGQRLSFEKGPEYAKPGFALISAGASDELEKSKQMLSKVMDPATNLQTQ
jgi:G3E family GTPase